MLTDKEVIDKYETGELLSNIFDGFGRDDEGNALIEQLAGLHNAGQIDILLLIEQPSFQEIEGVRFLVGQHVFC